ncbi:unnamed protein product [Cunninghamella blakesleeana]
MNFKDEEDITSIYLERRRSTVIKKITSDIITPIDQEIELESINEKNNDSDNEIIKMALNDDIANVSEFSLAPVDGGINAYLVLISGFLIEGFVWGFPFCYSVMQQYYQQLPEFKNASLTELALVGTLTSGVAYIGGAVVGVLGGRFNLKTIMYTGSLLMSISLVGASFATHVWHLILCQGFLLGLGGSFLYNGFISFVPMYWYKYRGLATGIIFSGAGLFGIIFPIIIEKALKAIGFRWTLRIVAIVVFIICVGSSIIIRPRHVPDANNNNKNVGLSKNDFKFLSTKKFFILGLATLFQGLGYFIPSLFIQPYALSIGVSEHNSVNLVSILNAMCIISQLLIGHISDRFGFAIAITISSTFSALTTFFLWGFAGNNYSILLAFIILYPIFGSGFTSCFPSMIYDVAESDHRQFIMINGAFMVLRGVGNIVGNPIGSILLSSASSVATGYNEMTYFVGSAMVASAIFSTTRSIMIKTR